MAPALLAVALETGETGPAEAEAALEANRGESVAREYEVVEGDNIYSIAKKFGLSPETLMWANNLGNVDLLSIGQRLTVPGGDGVLHTVEAGDTVSTIAQGHSVSPEAVTAYPANHLDQPDLLQQGQRILVSGVENPSRSESLVSSRGGTRAIVKPDKVPEQSEKAPKGMVRPTSGPITTYFVPGYEGIDLAPPYGTVVRASAGGRVVTMERLESGRGCIL